MKNKTKEKWIQWKPLGNLGDTEYDFKSIVYEDDHLVITLKSFENKKTSKKADIEIRFDRGIKSYRRTNESFYMKSWGTGAPFFKVENSEYINCLTAAPKYKKKLKHFAFIDIEEIVEVISTYDPEIKFVELKKDLDLKFTEPKYYPDINFVESKDEKTKNTSDVEISIGQLPDGRMVVSRSASAGKKGVPILEIQGPGKSRIKIRYPNEK